MNVNLNRKQNKRDKSLSPKLCYAIKSGMFLLYLEERYLIIVATIFFFNDNIIRYFGFVVDSNVIIYKKAVPCYFFLNLLVKYYNRSQHSKLHLTRSQSMDKWILHFKSRGIEILTALIELLCISEIYSIKRKRFFVILVLKFGNILFP